MTTYPVVFGRDHRVQRVERERHLEPLHNELRAQEHRREALQPLHFVIGSRTTMLALSTTSFHCPNIHTVSLFGQHNNVPGRRAR